MSKCIKRITPKNINIKLQLNAIAIIVSEETGGISYVKDGELFNKRTAEQLEQFLNRVFTKSK